MAGIAFYILDLETNGLVSGGFHEICEFSILRASDRVQLTRQVKVDKPKNSSLDAMTITKKSMADYAKGISKSQLVADAEKFLSEDGLTPAHRCLVGHNIINFDRKFLWALWGRYSKEFPFELFLDTLHMAKAAAKKKQLIKPKLNLSAACEIFGVKKVAGEHNALSDTRNCFFLWEKLMKEIDYLDHISRMPHRKDNE
jgi:DNA polymerase III epsilon subunit-like protein